MTAYRENTFSPNLKCDSFVRTIIMNTYIHTEEWGAYTYIGTHTYTQAHTQAHTHRNRLLGCYWLNLKGSRP